MRVPDTMRRCVVFLYCKVRGKLYPYGTGFFLAYPVPGVDDSNVAVLMTAQHVIAGCQDDSDDGKVYIRVNTEGGPAKFIESAVGDWYQPDAAIDVTICTAASDLILEDHSIEFGAWAVAQNVATQEVMEREGIGVGDEVFMVGLFTSHTGQTRNEPIIRVGNIASVPGEPIPTETGPADAILIEARSIGGLSGSPVFVHMGYARWREGKVMQSGTETPFFFLGVMRGHWEVAETEIDSTHDAGDQTIHTGVGFVIPADTIMKRILDPFVGEAAQMKANRNRSDSHE